MLLWVLILAIFGGDGRGLRTAICRCRLKARALAVQAMISAVAFLPVYPADLEPV